MLSTIEDRYRKGDEYVIKENMRLIANPELVISFNIHESSTEHTARYIGPSFSPVNLHLLFFLSWIVCMYTYALCPEILIVHQKWTVNGQLIYIDSEDVNNFDFIWYDDFM